MKNNPISKVASKKVLKMNKEALKSYEFYKRTYDLIDRTNYVLGRKSAYKINSGSTLIFEVNTNAISSTTAQKI